MRTEDEISKINPFVATITSYRWRDLNGNRDTIRESSTSIRTGPDFIRSVVRDTGR